jgi:hypothetical protein
MSQDKDGTLYDKTMRQLKNNPLVVVILVLGVVFAGLAQGLDIFNKIKDAVFPSKAKISEVHVTIQPYDLITGSTASPILRLPAVGRGLDVDQMAQNILDEILAVVKDGSATEYSTHLQIKDNLLSADQPVNGELTLLMGNSPVQAPTTYPLPVPGLTEGTDLAQYFADRMVFDPDCSCIHLILSAPKNGFLQFDVEIYQVPGGYSFKRASRTTSLPVDFKPTSVSILLQVPQGKGTDQASIDALQSSLDYALRQRAGENDLLKLSPYKSEAELRAVVDPLIPALEPGAGKGNILDQYRVDFIVTVDFVVK